MKDEQLLRYSRHILLQDFDVAGQEALLQSTILIIGAGGLGCPAAMYLASSGIGHIIIADDDIVEVSNLQRQIAHSTTDIDKPKVESLKETLEALNPDVKVTALHQRLAADELQQWVSKVDVVLDCCDNFTTRFLINESCVKNSTPLVSGAAVRAEGQIAVFDNRSPQSPCYCCLYDDVDEREVENCSENGVLAPLVGVIGSLQALEAIKLLAVYGEPSVGKLLVADLRYGDWRQLKLSKNENCSVCSNQSDLNRNRTF